MLHRAFNFKLVTLPSWNLKEQESPLQNEASSEEEPSWKNADLLQFYRLGFCQL